MFPVYSEISENDEKIQIKKILKKFYYLEQIKDYISTFSMG